MDADKTYPQEIDLVYLWVNGQDPAWRKKRSAFSGETYTDEGIDCEARYEDNGELKYSLRSVDMYAPWIRNIFIVTDNQVPSWINPENPKIKIIDHKEILPAEALPTFNSVVIEHCLHKIPGLSEYFLYANDDMFFNREVKPSDFFTKEGYPIVRFNRRLFRKVWHKFVEKVLKKPQSNYNITIQNAASLVEKKYGRYIGHKTHHNIDAYRKSDYSNTFNTFKDFITPTLTNHIRSENDIQRNLYSYVPFVEGRAKVRFVNQNTSFRCHIEKPKYFNRLVRSNPMLFCLNDSQYANAESHQILKKFLRERFPHRSQFEKNE